MNTHHALVFDATNGVVLIAAGGREFCRDELSAWLDTPPLRPVESAEVVARIPELTCWGTNGGGSVESQDFADGLMSRDIADT